VRRGWKLRELSAHESSLEEIFTSFVDRIPGMTKEKTPTKEPAKL
jgi:hypothetical protein